MPRQLSQTCSSAPTHERVPSNSVVLACSDAGPLSVRSTPIDHCCPVTVCFQSLRPGALSLYQSSWFAMRTSALSVRSTPVASVSPVTVIVPLVWIRHQHLHPDRVGSFACLHSPTFQKKKLLQHKISVSTI
jgi:hypothetical protein